MSGDGGGGGGGGSPKVALDWRAIEGQDGVGADILDVLAHQPEAGAFGATVRERAAVVDATASDPAAASPGTASPSRTSPLVPSCGAPGEKGSAGVARVPSATTIGCPLPAAVPCRCRPTHRYMWIVSHLNANQPYSTPVIPDTPFPPRMATKPPEVDPTKYAHLGGGGTGCPACGKRVYPAEEMRVDDALYHRAYVAIRCLLAGAFSVLFHFFLYFFCF